MAREDCALLMYSTDLHSTSIQAFIPASSNNPCLKSKIVSLAKERKVDRKGSQLQTENLPKGIEILATVN